MDARISFRAGCFLWQEPAQCEALLSFLAPYRDTVREVAFFTSATHPPLPLAVIQGHARRLREVIPQFQAAGFSAGINHLSTLGHLDENLALSLNEPTWQHLVDLGGAVSPSCYCVADPQVQQYTRQCYRALAAAGPEFIWLDDDLRLEHHGGIAKACFCEHCLADFAQQTGRRWSREELCQALSGGERGERLALRRAWLEHNRRYLHGLCQRVRAAVDEIEPAIALGQMTGEIGYSGYGFDRWVEALAGPRQIEVKWRPGGGFYTDDTPLAALDKAHSVGRQIAFLPPPVRDIQYEHENFPYQVLRKSRTIFTAEMATAIGAGCTGVALNCMGISSDPLDEYRPYFESVRAGRGFFNAAVDACRRSPVEGIWVAFSQDHVAVQAPDGDWATAPTWGGSLQATSEMAQIGLPVAYTPAGAVVTVLSGSNVLDLEREQLQAMLAGAVLLDGSALQHLHDLGLGELAGFRVRETRTVDLTEVLTADPLNGRFAGWHRDCRPSFWPENSYLLEPLDPAARPLAMVIDFAPTTLGVCAGAFENALGGRVAVLGYYPWRSLQSLAKSSQMKVLARWLSRETLPAYVDSFHRVAVWCRRDARGNPALMLVNASLDTARNACVAVRGDIERLVVRTLGGRSQRVARGGQAGAYSLFTLPGLGPWQPALCTVR